MLFLQNEADQEGGINWEIRQGKVDFNTLKEGIMGHRQTPGGEEGSPDNERRVRTRTTIGRVLRKGKLQLGCDQT